MFGIFRLIRLRTIAFAAFTMYAMRYFVIRPILAINDFQLQLSDLHFTALVFAVCCLISGGYVINDYFDTKVDRIAGIKDVVVGKYISRRAAITLHSVLNFLAVSIAFYLSWSVGIWKIGILFLLVSGVLWFYSSCYKKYFIVGNLIVGILASLIPLSSLIFEIPLLNQKYADILILTDSNFIYLFRWVLGFSYFAFLNTLMYEVNKDLYTLEGDRENGIYTFPVKLGVKNVKRMISGLALISILSLVVLYFTVFADSLLLGGYILLFLIIPYGVYIFSVIGSRQNRRFQLRLIRLLMVLCMSFSFLLEHFFRLIFA